MIAHRFKPQHAAQVDVSLTVHPASEWKYSLYEKLILQRAHPTKLVFQVLSLLWMGYFLWNHDWIAALVSGVGLSVIGSALVWRADLDQLARTPLGKLMRVHAHPINLALHLLSTPGFVLGLWLHSGAWFLVGLSIAALGHLWGWEEVESSG